MKKQGKVLDFSTRENINNWVSQMLSEVVYYVST